VGFVVGPAQNVVLIENWVIGTAKLTTAATTNSTTIGITVVSRSHVADILTVTTILGAWSARKHPVNGDRAQTVTLSVLTLTCIAICHPTPRNRPVFHRHLKATTTLFGQSTPIRQISYDLVRILSSKPIALKNDFHPFAFNVLSS
jgi:hypothetical protein